MRALIFNELLHVLNVNQADRELEYHLGSDLNMLAVTGGEEQSAFRMEEPHQRRCIHEIKDFWGSIRATQIS